MGENRGRLTPKDLRIEILKSIEATCKTSGVSQQVACQNLGISLRTIQRWKKSKTSDDRRTTVKKSPPNKLTQDEEDAILKIINSQEYAELPPCKIVPLLADKGVYLASESTMYRILRRKKQLKHRRSSKAAKKIKPKALKATRPNQIYCWDITYLPTEVRGRFLYLYFFMDLFSRKIVGWQIFDKESNEYSADLLKEIYIKEEIKPGQIFLHSDNGGPMKGATMLATLQKLGVMPSFSRPSVSNDNPYSESLFKTLKYCPIYPENPFVNLKDSREWATSFVAWYNNEHLHSGIKFVTPAERHAEKDSEILKNRHEVYQMAKKNNPIRWSCETRNWNMINEVLLNPGKRKVAI